MHKPLQTYLHSMRGMDWRWCYWKEVDCHEADGSEEILL